MALLETALAEMPYAQQSTARGVLADVQVRMCRAATPADRLAVAVAALGESMLALQQGLASLCRNGG